VAINSQLQSCTVSEVAAMIEGAMHHRTEMDDEANYVNSHGQSEIGVRYHSTAGFDLKSRLTRINVTKLYVPDAELRGSRPRPGADAVPPRPDPLDLIEQQYDHLIKYAPRSTVAPRPPTRSCVAGQRCRLDLRKRWPVPPVKRTFSVTERPALRPSGLPTGDRCSGFGVCGGPRWGKSGVVGLGRPWERRFTMLGLLVLLLIVWLVAVVLGVVIKGLFWLVIIGAILFVATGVIGFVKREALGRKR
jgi:Tn3 transposase DDE domain